MPDEQKAHRMQLPGEVVIGSGVVHQLGEVVQRVVPSRRVMLITNKDLMNIVGNDAVTALEQAKYDVEVVYIKKATDQEVEKCCEQFRNPLFFCHVDLL